MMNPGEVAHLISVGVQMFNMLLCEGLNIAFYNNTNDKL